MSYVELADIRNWVGIQDSGDDPELDAALLSVDSVIDDYCGDDRDDGFNDIGAVEYDGEADCDTRPDAPADLILVDGFE